LSEVRLGLVPAVVAPYLVNAVGARQARALFLAAEIVSAERALHIGLVHEVVSDSALIATRERIIEALLLGAPGAQSQAKELVSLCANSRVDKALMMQTAQLLAERRASPEGRDGLNAFLEKRAPGWRTAGGS
jgi:methylglutaconyl-CoA hydratase